AKLDVHPLNRVARSTKDIRRGVDFLQRLGHPVIVDHFEIAHSGLNVLADLLKLPGRGSQRLPQLGHLSRRVFHGLFDLLGLLIQFLNFLNELFHFSSLRLEGAAAGLVPLSAGGRDLAAAASIVRTFSRNTCSLLSISSVTCISGRPCRARSASVACVL